MAPKTQTVKPGTDENVINLDFRDLGPRGAGKAAQVPPGDYLLEVVSAKNIPVDKTPGARQILWVFRIVGLSPQLAHDEEAQAGLGDAIYARTGLGEKSLWFLRNLIEDLMNKEVTGSALGLRLDDKAGKRVGATLNWGRPYIKDGEEITNSEIKATFPASRFPGYEAPAAAQAAPDAPEEQEAPAPKAKANGRAPSPAAAAEAVSTADEDEDIEELAIQSL